MIDLLRCLLGYWPRSHPAPQTIVARELLADLGERGLYAVTRRRLDGTHVTTTENLAK